MSKNVKELKGKILNPNLDYKEEKLKENLLNPNLDYRNELKQLLIEQLREHQLDFNLEGEGDNEVITLSRQAVMLAKSNKELSSLIVKCIQSNIRINLLGLANELMNARITRPVFNERTVTVADQQEMMFEIKEGKIDSTKSLKALKNRYLSEDMKESLKDFDKSTKVRTAGNYSLPMLLIEMNKAGVITDELKDKLLDPNADYNLEHDIQNYYCNKCELSTIMENAKMLGLNCSVMNRDGKFYCDFGREDLILFTIELNEVDKLKYIKQQKLLSDFCRGEDLNSKPVIDTRLQESLRNPSLDYKEELKKQLFEALDKNELEYKVSEGI